VTAPKLVPVPHDEARVRDRILLLARPVTARNEGLTEVLTDLVPMHLAVHAVSATSSHATDVPATPDHTTSAATETDDLDPMLAPVVTANPTVTLARRAPVAMVVSRAHVEEVKSATQVTTGIVGPARHATVPTVLRTRDARHDLTARSVRLDVPVRRVRAVDLLLALTVVMHVIDVKRVPTPTDGPARRRAGREADRVTDRAIHRVGAGPHGPLANLPLKR
jgi:hypothetical protein